MNLATLHLTVRQSDTLHLPEYAGSMLRGAFGHALRELACITALPDCSQCPLNQQCRYTYIFETQLINAVPNQQASNPYVIKLPKSSSHTIKSTQTWSFGVILMGESIKDYELVLKAWQQAVRFGFDNQGKRSCGELIKVSNQTQTLFLVNQLALVSQAFSTPHWQLRRIPTLEPMDKLTKITLHFITPFRIQHQGKIAFQPHQLDPKILLINLYNRIRQCNQQHDIHHLWQDSYTDFNAFLQDIEKLTIKMDLTSVKVKRHSNRQNRKIELFGLIGDIHLTADKDILNRLLALLWLGQYLHVGKNTTLGLGQYQLRLR